jgi:hypothetical protein
VSPIHVVPKKSGDWRLCIDMHRGNEALECQGYAISRGEEILHVLNGSIVVSNPEDSHLCTHRHENLKSYLVDNKIDFKWGYHQIILSKNLRGITTFCTHVGLFRLKRLMFSLNCTPEMYHCVFSQIFRHCAGIVTFLDDIIIVYGASRNEDDIRLVKVLDI